MGSRDRDMGENQSEQTVLEAIGFFLENREENSIESVMELRKIVEEALHDHLRWFLILSSFTHHHIYHLSRDLIYLSCYCYFWIIWTWTELELWRVVVMEGWGSRGKLGIGGMLIEMGGGRCRCRLGGKNWGCSKMCLIWQYTRQTRKIVFF